MSRVQVQKIHALTGHRDCVYTIAPSAESHLFFSGAGDGMVVQWNLNHPEEGERIAQLPNSIYALHYVKDRDVLVVGHNYDGIHLLDWRSRKEVASLKLTTAAIFDIQSAGQWLWIADGEGVLTKVNLDSLTIVGKVKLSDEKARSIALLPQRGELAVGSSDGFIRMLDADSLTVKQQWRAHDSSVFALTYTPDYQVLLSGSRDARLKAWHVSLQYQLAEEVVAHLFAINHIAFSPDGKHFVTCSMDKSIKVWQTGTLQLIKVIDKARHAGHGTSVNKLLWTFFDDQLVSASDDRSLSVWKLIF